MISYQRHRFREVLAPVIVLGLRVFSPFVKPNLSAVRRQSSDASSSGILNSYLKSGKARQLARHQDHVPPWTKTLTEQLDLSQPPPILHHKAHQPLFLLPNSDAFQAFLRPSTYALRFHHSEQPSHGKLLSRVRSTALVPTPACPCSLVC